MVEVPLRVVGLCVALAAVEMLHGIARTLFLVPRVGRERSQRIGIVSGSLLAFLVCLVLVPTLGLTGRAHLVALGLLLAGFMAAFDAAVGRYAVRRPWKVVREDFNPAKGNLLVVGLVLLTFFPLLVMALAAPR